MGEDYYAKGQQAEKTSREQGTFNETVDIFMGTGRYNIPSDPEDREAFLAGMQNAHDNPPQS